MPRGVAERRVHWTEQEWFDLGDRVWEERRLDPDAYMTELIRRAQNAILAEPRRKIVRTMGGMERIVQRLADIDNQFKEEMDELRSEIERLNRHLAEEKLKPGPAEVLGTLTDKEMLERFGKRVLDLLSPSDALAHFGIARLLGVLPTPELVGYSVQKVMDDFARRPLPLYEMLQAMQHKNGQPAAPMRVPLRHAVVTIFGGNTTQQEQLRKAAGPNTTIHFIESGKTNQNIPRNTEWVIVWTNFASHAQQRLAQNYARASGKLILHTGGLKRLKDTLADLLAGKEVEVTC